MEKLVHNDQVAQCLDLLQVYSVAYQYQGKLVIIYAPAEVTIFLSADIPRNRLGASILNATPQANAVAFWEHSFGGGAKVRIFRQRDILSTKFPWEYNRINGQISLNCRHFEVP